MITGDIKTIADLEDELSRPSEADAASLGRLDGDILILGAGGKMEPSLARLCRRAADLAGKPRRVIAVARREAPLQLARQLGAVATLDVSRVPNVVEAVRDLTEDRRGADGN